MSSETIKRKSRTNWLVLLLNGFCILALLLSYISAHFAPSVIGYFALFGLAYPFILLSNLIFIVYWLFKRKRFALLSVVAIFLGFTHLTDFIQISFPEVPADKTKSLKVLTYNVRLFGLYEKQDNLKIRDSIFDLLDRENADVVCFQEFFHSNKRDYFTTRDTLVKFLPSKYYHERYTHALNGKDYFGVALFSKYPIINKGYIPFENDVNNFCIFADLKIGSDTIRVYDAHLQSIRFRPEDYAFVEDNKNREELEKGSKRIARRLKIAFQKRAAQVDKVAGNIETCNHKVIVCGDFNDTPVSYAYETFSDILNDSFCEAGNGISNTYIGNFPSFRIDYVFHSKEMICSEYKVLPEKLSDHHPVAVTLYY